MNLIGKILSNRYEILEEIGQGGMAYVYKAKCNLLNRYVAIKVLKSEFAKDENFVRRFKAEAQSAASLTHPNIVSVYDVGQEDGINYIVMELLESKTLKDYIEEKGALDNETVLKISAQIASALEAAHKAHIVHRDIKPHNIILNRGMVAKVTDFGIAKIASTATITNMGNTMGSVHYFSPEQAKGVYTDEKSDIYSLGVVMYEMATGKLPFNADSPISVALKHIQEEPIAPNVINSRVSSSLNSIILKAMAKNTSERYKDSTALLDNITSALRDPDKLILKPPSSIEAGATQVIPIIAMKENDQYKVQNIRMRQPRRISLEENPQDASSSGRVKFLENNENEEDIKEEKTEIKHEKRYLKIFKTKKAAIIAAVIASFFIILFGFAILKINGKLNGNPNQVEIYIPNLVGRKLTDVVEEYSKQGITIQQDSSKYDDELQEGYIISQTPEQSTLTKDKIIYVVVSKGQKLVTVPDVVGKDYKVAKYELGETLGFVVEMKQVVSDTIAEGIVVSQDLEKEKDAPYGSTIVLEVSKGDGKAKVIMPSVLGKTEAEAKKALQDLKLSVSVKYDEDESKDNGVVLTQSYPTNQELKEGTLVELKVNKLLISKTVSLDLLALQGGSIPAGSDENTSMVVKVVASIDSGAANTVYEKTHKVTEPSTSFAINGYSTAKLQIYINSKKVKDLTINFLT